MSLEEAMRRHRAGDRAGAETAYRAVLAAEPERAAAWHGLGLIAAETGRLAEAERLLAEAAGRAPGSAALLVDLAKVEHGLGKRDEALALLQRAQSIAPGDPLPLLGLATLLPELGRAREGLIAAEQAAAVVPDSPEAWAILGSTARRAGNLARAAEAFGEGIRRFPGLARLQHNLGAVLIEAGRSAEAEAPLRAAIAAAPDFAPPYFNLGIVLLHTDRPMEAVDVYRQALGLMPDRPQALSGLAVALRAAGDTEAAIATFTQALALDPQAFSVRWSAALTLPIVYDSEAEIDVWRQRWRDGVAALQASVDLSSPAGLAAAYAAVTTSTDFHLPAQGRDDRADHEAYGALVGRIATAVLPEFAKPRPRRARAAGERIRVGFASAHLYAHSITRTHGRFLTGLDPARFDVTLFHLGNRRDEVTTALQRSAARFAAASGDRLAVARGIAAADLDILLYPDIGMDPTTQFLAALRLAPVQVNLGGQPVTSGLSSIDWFLAPDRMEPPGAEGRYTETVARLPGIGSCYPRPGLLPEAPVLPPDARGEGPVLLNLQSLFKLGPAFDGLYPRIARAVGPCRFWFLRGPAPVAAEKFRARLARAFAAEGLQADDFIRILPPQTPAGFAGLIGSADLVLDGIPWSGNNTCMDTLFGGRALVTWPQDTMRSRHAAAILEQVGLPELIAESADDFVRLAARLATDHTWRLEIEARIAENSHRLFEDPTPVEALARWIESVA